MVGAPRSWRNQGWEVSSHTISAHRPLCRGTLPRVFLFHPPHRHETNPCNSHSCRWSPEAEQGQAGFKLMMLLWGDVNSRLCIFYIKSRTEPQRYLQENVQTQIGLWSMMLVRKKITFYFNIKLLEDRSKTLSKTNVPRHTDPQGAVWGNLYEWEGGAPEYLRRSSSIFSPNEHHMIFSCTLLHVAHKTDLFWTLE